MSGISIRHKRARMPDLIGDADKRFMAAAVRIGNGALGETWPNPAVGAIVVKNNRVVASARTGRGGRPHAERSALLAAGKQAEGATLYVSLEPCAHFGKTPPCADAVIAAGLSRVVVGLADPDERVRGRGIAALRKAGIAVEFALQDVAEQAHAGHLARTRAGRPWVVLKLAISGDGMIGRKGRGQVAITSQCASRHVHALRSRFDGILVGRGTVEADDPQLTCRLPGLAGRSPARIVLDTNGALDANAKVFAKTGATPVFHMVSDDLPSAPRARAGHIEVMPVTTRDDGIDLADALRQLGGRGLTRILVEGGAAVAASFLDAGLVDEIILFRSPVDIGPGGIPAFAPGALESLASGCHFQPAERRKFGPDRMIRYKRI